MVLFALRWVSKRLEKGRFHCVWKLRGFRSIYLHLHLRTEIEFTKLVFFASTPTNKNFGWKKFWMDQKLSLNLRLLCEPTPKIKTSALWDGCCPCMFRRQLLIRRLVSQVLVKQNWESEWVSHPGWAVGWGGHTLMKEKKTQQRGHRQTDKQADKQTDRQRGRVHTRQGEKRKTQQRGHRQTERVGEKGRERKRERGRERQIKRERKKERKKKEKGEKERDPQTIVSCRGRKGWSGPLLCGIWEPEVWEWVPNVAHFQLWQKGLGTLVEFSNFSVYFQNILIPHRSFGNAFYNSQKTPAPSLIFLQIHMHVSAKNATKTRLFWAGFGAETSGPGIKLLGRAALASEVA